MKKLSIALCGILISSSAAAQTSLPPNPDYPYPYAPEKVTRDLSWGLTSGGEVPLSIPGDSRRGKLKSTTLRLETGPGERSYEVTVPNGGMLHIEQWFRLVGQSLGIDESWESGPDFSYACSGDPPCSPTRTFRAADSPYSGLGIGLESTVPYPIVFSPLLPELYPEDPAVETRFSVGVPRVVGSGVVSSYSAKTAVTLSVLREYEQWQINEVLAGALRVWVFTRLEPCAFKVGGCEVQVLQAEVTPRWDIPAQTVGRIGRWDSDGNRWITYSHFNWRQQATGIFRKGAALPKEQWPPEIDRVEGMDPAYGLLRRDGTYADYYPYYLDEVPYTDDRSTPFSVHSPLWRNGLTMTDGPDLLRAGNAVTFTTELVGVYTSHDLLVADRLAALFKEQRSDFAFSWSYYQIADDIESGRTVPDAPGGGIITVYWRGQGEPPADADPFPFLRVVDIRPGVGENTVDLRTDAEIPVAILSGQGHSAQDIDPATVRFARGGVAPNRAPQMTDANGDGTPDLLLYFPTANAGILCNDSGESVVGKTWTGELIAGTDSLIVTGCEAGGDGGAPPADAGADAGNDAAPGDAAAEADARDAGTSPPHRIWGCGCRLGHVGRSSGMLACGVAALGLIILRRRRKSAYDETPPEHPDQATP